MQFVRLRQTGGGQVRFILCGLSWHNVRMDAMHIICNTAIQARSTTSWRRWLSSRVFLRAGRRASTGHRRYHGARPPEARADVAPRQLPAPPADAAGRLRVRRALSPYLARRADGGDVLPLPGRRHRVAFRRIRHEPGRAQPPTGGVALPARPLGQRPDPVVDARHGGIVAPAVGRFATTPDTPDCDARWW